MGFKTLGNRARKDPFAFKLLNHILDNQRDTQALVLAGHADDGKHNALEVARAVGTAVWGGVTYTLEGSTPTIITTVTRISAGVVRINFNSSYFSLPMAVRVVPIGARTESLPAFATYTVDSTSQITVRIWGLSSLAGNTWALVDMDFAFAVHAKRYTPATNGVTPIANAKRGDTLGAGSAERWNRLIQNQAELRKDFLVEHTSAGVHKAREIARGWATIDWDGAAFTRTDSSDGITVSSFAGLCRLTLPAGYTMPFQVFPQANYDRVAGTTDDATIANTPRSLFTATRIDVYLYQYDSTTNAWARNEFGFSVSIHAVPA